MTTMFLVDPYLTYCNVVLASTYSSRLEGIRSEENCKNYNTFKIFTGN